jgi:hypothetical protein
MKVLEYYSNHKVTQQDVLGREENRETVIRVWCVFLRAFSLSLSADLSFSLQMFSVACADLYSTADSEDDEQDLEEDPIVEYKSTSHPGATNRVRVPSLSLSFLLLFSLSVCACVSRP